jgi:hypothetical protein
MNLTAKISKVIPADYSLKEIEFIIGGVKFLMKCIEGGTFMMGAQKSNVNESNYDSKAFDWESPIHSVSVGNYYIGETLVTQALWKAVMGHTPMPDNKQWNAQDGIGDNMPAYNISYIDAKKFAATSPTSINATNFKLRHPIIIPIIILSIIIFTSIYHIASAIVTKIIIITPTLANVAINPAHT